MGTSDPDDEDMRGEEEPVVEDDNDEEEEEREGEGEDGNDKAGLAEEVATIEAVEGRGICGMRANTLVCYYGIYSMDCALKNKNQQSRLVCFVACVRFRGRDVVGELSRRCFFFLFPSLSCFPSAESAR